MENLEVKVFKATEDIKDSNGNVIETRTYSRAKLPVRKHSKDSGADAFVCFHDGHESDKQVINPGTVGKVPLGIACVIPEGFEIQVRPRSGASENGHISVFGTVDEGYRGIIKANVENISTDPFVVSQGDRICQLVLAPVYRADFKFADDGEIIGMTDRGSNGFGSTGV